MKNSTLENEGRVDFEWLMNTSFLIVPPKTHMYSEAMRQGKVLNFPRQSDTLKDYSATPNHSVVQITACKKEGKPSLSLKLCKEENKFSKNISHWHPLHLKI